MNKKNPCINSTKLYGMNNENDYNIEADISLKNIIDSYNAISFK